MTFVVRLNSFGGTVDDSKLASELALFKTVHALLARCTNLVVDPKKSTQTFKLGKSKDTGKEISPAYTSGSPGGALPA